MMRDLKVYLFIKKNSTSDYCKALFSAMKSELSGYDTSWSKDDKGNWKEYKNGVLRLDGERYTELIWMNENNITILNEPWNKLRFYIASLLHSKGAYTQEDANVELDNLVQEIRELFPEFNRFDFPKVTELNYRQYYYNIEDTGEPPLINYGKICSYSFIKHIEEYVPSILDMIFKEDYILILDDMEEGYIDRMLADNVINKNDYKVILFNDDKESVTVINE